MFLKALDEYGDCNLVTATKDENDNPIEAYMAENTERKRPSTGSGTSPDDVICID